MKRLFLFDTEYYVVAPTEKAAIDFYIEEMGVIQYDDEDDMPEIEEIPQNEWKDHFWNMDETNSNGDPIVMSIAECLEQFSDDAVKIVATSEY